MAERILITQLGFLGDVILSTPVIAALGRRYPEAEIDFLTTKAASPLVRYHPRLTQVHAYDRRGADRGVAGFVRLLRELKARGYSKVFSLHRSARTTLLHYLAEIPERYGFSEARFAFLYTGTVARNRAEHDVLRNLSLLKAVGVPTEGFPLCIEMPAEVEEAARRLVGEASYIAIAPGSVWRTKRWTVEGFSAVSRELIRQGHRVVLLGAGEDEAAGRVIERRAPGVTNLIGRTDLLTSAAVIKGASAVLANDSSPLHLASAFRRPTVALFCATVPEFGFGPWETKSVVLGVEGLSCRPCGRHGRGFCPTGTHACQRGISVERVLEALAEVRAP
jgi:heptosyltransferase-2